ncbi:uncharacterized protein L969DRAFT_621145 [Mixia osmundae IAM 14324]|uniref:uncharacterized protein n=1 Tax=Mixia osmundae (strain CBS 9802 / IAM 14324 / JCM 22182 / KY 12970) TaxID=764103 RepID=UPI0004A54A42|nr:uncharacterized protein L969DRAFT_621145 [Mixia osmundae IAM 14324]KEI40381.1 hypothetical protein L969DRAFT_621145 [Mixia osmundae IAM 14324]
MAPSKGRKDRLAVPKQPVDELDYQNERLLDGALHDLTVHERIVQLCKQLGLADRLEAARKTMSDTFTLPDAFWLDWLADRQALAMTVPVEPENVALLLMLCQRAMQDYLSIPISSVYAKTVIDIYKRAHGSQALSSDDADAMAEDTLPGDQALAQHVDADVARSHLAACAKSACRHITGGQPIWRAYVAFEEGLLSHKRSLDQTSRVANIYLERLAQPHAGIEDTFQAYSTFVSNFEDQGQYEDKMVAANAIVSAAKTSYSLRERYESRLTQLQYTPEAYTSYIDWELEVDAPDLALVEGLFERAVNDNPASVDLWDQYLRHLTRTLPTIDLEEIDEVDTDAAILALANAQQQLVAVAERAVKAIPGAGQLWATYLRILERCDQREQVQPLFERATAIRAVFDTVDSLVDLFTAKTDFHRRDWEAVVVAQTKEPDELFQEPADILNQGINTINKRSRDGDPQCRLQHYLSRLLERFGQPDEAAAVWKRATTKHSDVAAAHIAYAELEARRNNTEAAREIYERGAGKRLDYPEYLFSAWRSFEHQHGTIETLEKASRTIEQKMKGVNARRRKEQEQLYASYAAQAPQPASTAVETAVEPAQPVASTSAVPAASASPMLDTRPTENGSSKRRAEDSPEAVEESIDEEGKRAKTAHTPAQDLKRDREHTTVIVSGLPMSTKEPAIRRLFKDCGDIRELQMHAKTDGAVASIEFVARDSILAALTKDKRRVEDQEISVALGWRSTCYVTNFPESSEDKDIRTLFEPYGEILATRWPSKRFNSARRFCYIQFVSPASAESALALHGTELEPKRKLSVYISDPDRKRARTDADTHRREILVSQLTPFVKEYDLRKLFTPCGVVTAIRIQTDAKGLCRGAAFVDFEDVAGAAKALELNNTEFKKRHIAVVLASQRGLKEKQPESGQGRKADATSRSVTATGLPDGVLEPLLQQVFERYGSVKSVTIAEDGKTAQVEYESEAVCVLLGFSKGALTCTARTSAKSYCYRRAASLTKT